MTLFTNHAINVLSRVGLCAALSLTAACTQTASEEIAVPLELAGTAADSIAGRDGWTITLSQADVAFGPLYLCSGVTAGDLCDTARAEWLDSTAFDALNPAPLKVGMLEGTSGMTRSWMYDHGIAALLTQEAPVALAGAQALGGDSVLLVGTATRDGQTVHFSAALPIQQGEETEKGVPVVRKSGSDFFSHDITGSERLRIRFDPGCWVEDIDFTAIAGESETTDVVLDPDGQAVRAIRTAIVAGERPSFDWN